VNHEAVVVVDDEEAMRDYLKTVLAADGYECACFADSISALAHLASPHESATLILSDIGMPDISGLELLRTVKAIRPDLPFVLISGKCDLTLAMEALRSGASDYLLKPALPEEVLRVVRKQLSGNGDIRQSAFRRALRRFLEERRISGGASASVLAPLFDTLGFKRFETLQHSQRVAAYSCLLGTRFGLDGPEWNALELGALLHDIGKAAIPYNVLMKPGPLTPEEWHVMRMHPTIGWQMLNDIPGLRREEQIVYSHHERFDGNGYPRGLRGGDIPAGARIFAVVDTLDAILSDRPYRRGGALSVARVEIERMTGTQFDPGVTACLRIVTDGELFEVRDRFPDELAEPHASAPEEGQPCEPILQA
jgi:response regulator RpfG family c-di-GMP phosphodiesterase